jgi:hypothetical protein
MTTLEKSVSLQGFEASWHFEHEQVVFNISAPTGGWVALGFNQRDDIVHSNLVMGAVVDGELIIEDQYVVSPGKHPSVKAIGGEPAVFAAEGLEENGRTAISFHIPQTANDQFHYDLAPSQEIHLICAYSQEDDFAHHSRMRKHIKVTL